MAGFGIFDLLVLVFLAVFVLIYAKRGFIKTVLKFAKTLLAFLMASLLGSRVGAALCNAFIGEKVRASVFDKILAMYENTAGGLQADAVMSEFPGFLQTESVREALLASEGKGEVMVQNVTDAIATPIATAISNILGYILVFVVSLIVFSIATIFLGKLVEKIPVIGRINSVLGGVLGFAVALLILFVVSAVLKLVASDSSFLGSSFFLNLFGNAAFGILNL